MRNHKKEKIPTLTFKSSFLIPTKDLKKSEYMELSVKSNIPISGELIGDPEYSVVIPTFMFDELADTEPRFSTTYDVNNRDIKGCFSDRTLTRKFKKTQTSKSISVLKSFFSELTSHINKRHSIETKTLKKKIFITFNHSLNHTRSNLNAAYRGQTINQSFNYFIGYEMMSERFDGFEKKLVKMYVCKIEYHSKGSSLYKRDTNFQEKDDLLLDVLHHNQSIKDFEDQCSIIDWTQEREDFCKRIQDTFVKINNELSEFLKNIDDNKMDQLMSGNALKFLK